MDGFSEVSEGSVRDMCQYVWNFDDVSTQVPAWEDVESAINDVNTTLTFGAAPLTLTPGEQTALPDYNICPSLTFYFCETTTEGCWTAGHTPDYYEGLCDNQVSLQ